MRTRNDMIGRARMWCSTLIALHHMRSEEHTTELQSPVPNSYAVFCFKNTKYFQNKNNRYKNN